jgi:hypothetical protein
LKKNISEIKFLDLFNNERTLSEFSDCCNTHLVQQEIYEFGLYLIIRLQLSFQNKLIDLSIKDFDPDNIIIPGSSFNAKLRSVILFWPFNLEDMKSGGHYTCFRRYESNNGWVHIDDEGVEYHEDFQNFIPDLKLAYLLFLEKK